MEVSERLYTAAELAAMCRVHIGSIRRWARLGVLPKGRRISGRCTRWTAEDVQSFLRSRGLLNEEAAR